MNTNRLMGLLPDMAVYVLVVETGSFTVAAERLGMTPSAVSRQISRLEKALEVKLLERTTRRQSTTEEGKAAYERCRAMVDCANEVGQMGQRSSRVAGHLTISSPKAYGKIVLQPLILSFLEAYPEIRIHFKVTDTLLNPLRDDVDLVFRISDQQIEGLVSKKIRDINLVLCASRAYLESHTLPEHPAELVDLSCLALGEHERDNQWIFHRSEERVKVDVMGRYTVNHSEMRLEAVKEGLGIGIFPDFVVAEALAQGEVIQVLADWQVKQKYQGAITLQFAQSKFMPSRLRCFIDYFMDHL